MHKIATITEDEMIAAFQHRLFLFCEPIVTSFQSILSRL
jgi:hypothetical protein